MVSILKYFIWDKTSMGKEDDADRQDKIVRFKISTLTLNLTQTIIY